MDAFVKRPCVRRRPIDLPAPPGARSRAWQAQLRLSARYHHLLRAGKPPCVAIAAVARGLCGFLWAAMTEQAAA